MLIKRMPFGGEQGANTTLRRTSCVLSGPYPVVDSVLGGGVHVLDPDAEQIRFGDHRERRRGRVIAERRNKVERVRIRILQTRYVEGRRLGELDTEDLRETSHGLREILDDDADVEERRCTRPRLAAVDAQSREHVRVLSDLRRTLQARQKLRDERLQVIR